MIRVLLDEDVPIKLRHHLEADCEVETVTYRGWSGLPNGELLRRAEEEYDVLVTLDRSIPAQQNLAQFKLAVVILRPAGGELEDVMELVPELNKAIVRVRPGETAEIRRPRAES